MGKSATPRRETRARIVETACALFNETGAERTTTRAIAEASGINEGNLYYHFRSKELLVLAVFERFEREAEALLSVPGSAPHPVTPAPATPDALDFPRRLRGWFELTWRYRFLFRDVAGLQQIAPALAPRLRRLSTRLQRSVRGMIAALSEAGLLAVGIADRDRLLDNLWIVASYWISFLLAQRGVKRIGPRHLEWGFAQVESLFAPYLSDAARAMLRGAPAGTP